MWTRACCAGETAKMASCSVPTRQIKKWQRKKEREMSCKSSLTLTDSNSSRMFVASIVRRNRNTPLPATFKRNSNKRRWRESESYKWWYIHDEAFPLTWTIFFNLLTALSSEGTWDVFVLGFRSTWEIFQTKQSKEFYPTLKDTWVTSQTACLVNLQCFHTGEFTVVMLY